MQLMGLHTHHLCSRSATGLAWWVQFTYHRNERIYSYYQPLFFFLTQSLLQKDNNHILNSIACLAERIAWDRQKDMWQLSSDIWPATLLKEDWTSGGMQNHHSSDSSTGVWWCAETLRELFRLHLCWDANVTAAECHCYPESLTYFLGRWEWKNLRCIKLDYKFYQISWTICNPLIFLFLKPNRTGYVASAQKCFLKYYFVDELKKKAGTQISL